MVFSLNRLWSGDGGLVAYGPLSNVPVHSRKDGPHTHALVVNTYVLVLLELYFFYYLLSFDPLPVSDFNFGLFTWPPTRALRSRAVLVAKEYHHLKVLCSFVFWQSPISQSKCSEAAVPDVKRGFVDYSHNYSFSVGV